MPESKAAAGYLPLTPQVLQILLTLSDGALHGYGVIADIRRADRRRDAAHGEHAVRRPARDSSTSGSSSRSTHPPMSATRGGDITGSRRPDVKSWRSKRVGSSACSRWRARSALREIAGNHARAYRCCSRVLPAGRRRAYGDAMAVVFGELVDETRRASGAAGVLVLWIETVGMVQDLPCAIAWPRCLPWFRPGALRAARAAGWSGPQMGVAGCAGARRAGDSDRRVARRRARGKHRDVLRGRLAGVRSRAVSRRHGWSNPNPVEVPARLAIALSRPRCSMNGANRRTCLSASRVSTRSIFLTGAAARGRARPTADVTIGLTDLLGASPEWGRALRAGDDQDAGAARGH